MGKKILIVGGVAGGASAAARLRRLDETAEIVMFEKDEYISFAICGMPYHIGDTITERSKLIVQTPTAMKKRFGIDVRNHSRVTKVDPAAKTVTVDSADKGVYTEGYDELILAPGCEPIVPNIPNTAPGRVYTLRTIPDTDRIKAAIIDNGFRSALIIGGGFIGIEMAENLRDIDVDVTLAEAMPHILAPFDDEMAAIVEKEMRDHGITLVLGDGLTAIEEGDGKAVVTLASGRKLEAEMIISAIGVRPATGFLQESDIQLGVKGHIIVNDQMETNVPHVYAVGDAIEITDFVTGLPGAVPLAGPANKQGRIVADKIAGIGDRHYRGTQGTAIIKVFGLAAACTGANEKVLRREGIPFTPLYSHPFSHATYYPGAVQMACKLMFHPDGRILGCQMVGHMDSGVDKRLDVVATVMRLKGKVTDLCELELAYAPPFSSAKDPVNMLGYMAQNVLEGRSNPVDYHYVAGRDPKTTMLIDVRTPDEFARGHIEGALNIPVDELRGRLDELDRNKEIIEYCQVGLRGHVADRILTQHGFKVKNLSGGWKTWSSIFA